VCNDRKIADIRELSHFGLPDSCRYNAE
jgi:hypothetical protein